MTKILVVDDSPIDRCLVGNLLAKEDAFDVTFACDGNEALAKIEADPPEVVLTDLVMPNCNGLELVKAVKARAPQVPVILMTSQGSERVAVEALQYGAASYMPKRALGSQLRETIEMVLGAARHSRAGRRLLGCMSESQYEFSLRNDPTLISSLVGFFQEAASSIGLCDQADNTRLGIALEEALVNALYHGNLDLDSKLRHHDERSYRAMVEDRLSQRPYCDRRIQVTANFSCAEAAFHIGDEGRGFDPDELPDPTDPANLENLTGRGILLMRTFMDNVNFNESGNAVTMVKRRSEAAPEQEIRRIPR
jgi:CheY-like chemotaxis protein/anti-sigma regulatory factor (Ser/Thr protein kinase)